MTLPARIWPSADVQVMVPDIHVAADEVHQALRGAARHDLLQLDAGLLREGLRQQMPERADAGRDVVDRLAAPPELDERP